MSLLTLGRSSISSWKLVANLSCEGLMPELHEASNRLSLQMADSPEDQDYCCSVTLKRQPEKRFPVLEHRRTFYHCCGNVMDLVFCFTASCSTTLFQNRGQTQDASEMRCFTAMSMSRSSCRWHLDSEPRSGLYLPEAIENPRLSPYMCWMLCQYRTPCLHVCTASYFRKLPSADFRKGYVLKGALKLGVL